MFLLIIVACCWYSILYIPLSVAPVIESPPDGFTYEIFETNDTTFECTATGFPAPTITFSMGSLVLDGGGTMGTIAERATPLPPVMTPLDDGTYQVTRRLMVTNAMDDDSGTYTCNASSTIPMLNPMEYTDSQDFEFLVLGTYEYIACHGI